MKTKIQGHHIQILISFGALLVGLIIYVLYRPLNSSYLGIIIHQLTDIPPIQIAIHDIIGGCLPDFLHPFAFALLCMALFQNANQQQRGWICLFWLYVNILFEVGQFYGEYLSRFIIENFHFMPFSKIFSAYFIGGTYDVIDIFAIMLGILSAFFVGEITNNIGGKEYEKKIFSKGKKEGSGFQHLGCVLGTSS